MEELMLRLFVMSLLSFILWKLFFRRCNNKQIPAGVFIVANIISAMLFSAGHLPATASMFGELSPWGGSSLLCAKWMTRIGVWANLPEIWHPVRHDWTCWSTYHF